MTEDENNNEPFDTEEFLENNKDTNNPEDFRNSVGNDMPEWYGNMQDEVITGEILVGLKQEREKEVGSMMHQEILRSVEQEVEENREQAVFDFDQDTEIYSRILDGNYHKEAKENQLFYGFMLAKEIEEKRQRITEETETIRMEFPEHYKHQTLEISAEDQDRFWNTLIEYFANEAYRQNFSTYAVENSNTQSRELLNHLTEITGENTLMEADIEELLMMDENTGRAFMEFKNGQSLDPYHEPFVEGVAYAQIDEKQS